MNFDEADRGPHVPLTIDYVLAGANYLFSTGWLRPYVSLNLGAASLRDVRATSRGAGPATNFAGSLAFGAKVFLFPRGGIRLEARGYASRLPRDFIFGVCNVLDPSDHLVPVSCGNRWFLNGDVTAGLMFAF